VGGEDPEKSRMTVPQREPHRTRQDDEDEPRAGRCRTGHPPRSRTVLVEAPQAVFHTLLLRRREPVLAAGIHQRELRI
jgi:hypothetical protein